MMYILCGRKAYGTWSVFGPDWIEKLRRLPSGMQIPEQGLNLPLDGLVLVLTDLADMDATLSIQ